MNRNYIFPAVALDYWVLRNITYMSVQHVVLFGRIIGPFHSKYRLASFHTRVAERIKDCTEVTLLSGQTVPRLALFFIQVKTCHMYWW